MILLYIHDGKFLPKLYFYNNSETVDELYLN